MLYCGNSKVSNFLGDAPANTAAASVLVLQVNVSGLSGTGLQIRNGSETLTINANGLTAFTTGFIPGQSYAASITLFPTSPTQYCSITNPSGVFAAANITLSVQCTAGSSAGPMVGGNIIHPLTLTGNADVILGQVFAGTIGINASTNGVGNGAKFSQPAYLASDGNNLFVLEASGALRKITIVTRNVTTLGNIGGSDSITSDGVNLYAVHFYGCTVTKMNLTTFAVTTLAGASFTCGMADAPSGPGTSVRFDGPTSITTDGAFLYVADYNNNRIRKVDINTGATTTLAGTGAATSVNGPAASATFTIPCAVTYYANKVYVGEAAFQAVRVIDLSSGPTVSTLAGNGSYGNVDGAPGTARFKRINNLTTDGTYIYVADKDSYSIRRVDITTGFVSTLSGWETGTTTVIGTGGGITGTARFRELTGITSDGTYLYVTDFSDHIIRRIE